MKAWIESLDDHDGTRSRLAVVLASLGIAVVWLARPERGGDTGPLLTGTEALGRCLTELDLVDVPGRETEDAHLALFVEGDGSLEVDGDAVLVAAPTDHAAAGEAGRDEGCGDDGRGAAEQASGHVQSCPGVRVWHRMARMSGPSPRM